MALIRGLGLRCAAFVAFSLVAACGPRGGAELVERTGVRMGSELRLSAWTADPAGAQAAFAEVFAEFERLDALMSVWREGSDIQQLNAAAGVRSVPVSEEVAEVLRAARDVSEWSDGAFDVTFGALSGLWRFDHDQDDRIPARSDVAGRLPLVDFRRLAIGRGTAFLMRTGMRVHLGGIGKGFGIDRAAEILRAHGVMDFLVQSGGDMYAGGRRDGRPWRLGIQDPRGPADAVFAALELSDAALSTSGDYERFFIRDGRRYHHILDPATGEPAAGSRSVTIVAGRSVLADALSTAVFVMGPDAGLALVERLPDVECVIVSVENEIIVSSGLRERLVRLRPPTDGL